MKTPKMVCSATSTLLTALAVSLVAPVVVSAASQPQALIYRGPSACDGCPEAVAALLQSSPQKFTVTYVGPNDTALSADSLRKASVYAQPGGPDLKSAYAELKGNQSAIRDFVSNGGRYLGFCLGAYLAGSSPGFGLLPPGVDTDSEIDDKNSQVKNDSDTIIQVDWTFRSTVNAFNRGATANSQWLYFQEGAVITGLNDSNSVLGRYSKNGHVAASLTPYGKGWVALTGPHPEADHTWYDAYGLKNPDGIKFDIGHDFVNAAMQAGGTNSSSQQSGWSPLCGGRGRVTLQNPIGWCLQVLKGFLM